MPISDITPILSTQMFDISPKNHQTRSHFLPKRNPIKRRDRAFYSFDKGCDRKIDEQVVDLMFADAYFDNLKPGKYTALVKHELVEPIEARYEFEIMTDSELSLILFNYLEPERVLLRINTIIAEE